MSSRETIYMLVHVPLGDMGHFKLLAARKSRFIAIWVFRLKFSSKEEDV